MDGKTPSVFLLAVPETNTQQPGPTSHVFTVFCLSEEQDMKVGIDRA